MTDKRDEFLVDHPHLSDFLPFTENLAAESPRGMVLISAGYLEQLLKDVLIGFFREVGESERLLDGGNAPLGTFSSRLSTAYVLGLISDEEFRELELIRKIRNEFAHNPKAAFTDSAIANRCRELHYRIPGEGDPEGHFSTAAVALILNFVNRAHYVRRQRRTFSAWPY